MNDMKKLSEQLSTVGCILIILYFFQIFFGDMSWYTDRVSKIVNYLVPLGTGLLISGWLISKKLKK